MNIHPRVLTVLTLVAASMLSACMPFSKIEDSSGMTELKGTWTVAYIAGEEITDDSVVPTISFNPSKSTVSGFNGCNRFQGAYRFEGGMLKADVSETRQACPNAVATAASKEIRTVLEEGAEVVKVEIGAGRVLMLKSDSAEIRMRPPEAPGK